MEQPREESLEEEKKEPSLLRIFSIIVIVVLLLSVSFVSFQLFFASKPEIVAPGPYPQPAIDPPLSSSASPLAQPKTEQG